MERGGTSDEGERQGMNQRQTEESNRGNFIEGSVNTSDTNTIVGEEMTHEEMKDNISEENVTLDQLRETLRIEKERDRDLAEQHARLTRQNARLVLQNRQLNEEVEVDATDSEVNLISSGEEELRRGRRTREEDGGERRKRRRENSEERELRRALEVSSWENQRKRYEEEQRHEEGDGRKREDERRREFNHREEEARRHGEGRLNVMRGGRQGESEGKLNQEVLDELRDMRALINNSRKGGRVKLAEAEPGSFGRDARYKGTDQ
ncbi:vicilin-like seed storage protein At2g18540 [Papaver somniferum]|uniref:vicilin-like seed storage protein At2g18540 n=1 Tax=Papaver somniferum TaxID=3469 RepID=UPI000E705455|nr:vicilin-like seed storage protein At2g18540 [Papaver somniferum]